MQFVLFICTHKYKHIWTCRITDGAASLYQYIHWGAVHVHKAHGQGMIWLSVSHLAKSRLFPRASLWKDPCPRLFLFSLMKWSQKQWYMAVKTRFLLRIKMRHSFAYYDATTGRLDAWSYCQNPDLSSMVPAVGACGGGSGLIMYKCWFTFLSLTSAVHFVLSSITAPCTNCIDRHIDTWFKAFKYQHIKIMLQAILKSCCKPLKLSTIISTRVL